MEESFDFYLCSNGMETDDILQTLDKPVTCIPVYTQDITLDDINQSRRKRSTDDSGDSWQPPRVNRGREIKTIHLPAPFTPRLGRRRAGSRMKVQPTKHVININAGGAFTPRLGRSQLRDF